MRRADSQDEGDGVHGVGFTRAIGADDGREVGVAKGEDVVSLVGLEVWDSELSRRIKVGDLLKSSRRTSFAHHGD